MNLVVDANVVIATLVKDGKTVEAFVNPLLSLHAPEFILEELLKYVKEISAKTHRSLESLSLMISDVLSLVEIASRRDIEPFLANARLISPDPKDDMYLALALKLVCPLWSNDARLKEQRDVQVYSTEEILKVLSLL